MEEGAHASCGKGGHHCEEKDRGAFEVFTEEMVFSTFLPHPDSTERRTTSPGKQIASNKNFKIKLDIFLKDPHSVTTSSPLSLSSTPTPTQAFLAIRKCRPGMRVFSLD